MNISLALESISKGFSLIIGRDAKYFWKASLFLLFASLGLAFFICYYFLDTDTKLRYLIRHFWFVGFLFLFFIYEPMLGYVRQFVRTGEIKKTTMIDQIKAMYVGMHDHYYFAIGVLIAFSALTASIFFLFVQDAQIHAIIAFGVFFLLLIKLFDTGLEDLISVAQALLLTFMHFGTLMWIVLVTLLLPVYTLAKILMIAFSDASITIDSLAFFFLFCLGLPLLFYFSFAFIGAMVHFHKTVVGH